MESEKPVTGILQESIFSKLFLGLPTANSICCFLRDRRGFSTYTTASPPLPQYIAVISSRLVPSTTDNRSNVHLFVFVFLLCLYKHVILIHLHILSLGFILLKIRIWMSLCVLLLPIILLSVSFYTKCVSNKS